MSKREMPLVPRGVMAAADKYSRTPNHSELEIKAIVAEQINKQGGEFVELAATLKDNIFQQRDGIAELRARMLTVEQMAAKNDPDRGYINPIGSASINAALMGAIENEQMAFNHISARNQGSVRLDMGNLSIKAALIHEGGTGSSGGDYMPTNPDNGGIVAHVQPQPRLTQFLKSRPVVGDAVRYIQLQTTGDVGVQAEEGTEKANIDFDGKEARANIATIAGHTTASNQVLADHTQLQNIISNVLHTKLQNKLCDEIINGIGGSDNTDPQINGLINQGTVLALPQTATLADQVGECIVAMQNRGFSPNLIVINPTDWLMDIATVKTLTEGTYLFGSPSNPAPLALWNIPVVLEPSLGTGTTLVLDTNYITMLDRMKASVLISNSHKDYFTRNLVAILAELRAGLEVLDIGAAYILESNSST